MRRRCGYFLSITTGDQASGLVQKETLQFAAMPLIQSGPSAKGFPTPQNEAAPKACDPWAVFTAKKEAGNNPLLTPVQEQIMTLIKNRGPLAAEDICKELNISEAEFRINFTTLRHMEIARASQQGDNIYYTTFGE